MQTGWPPSRSPDSLTSTTLDRIGARRPVVGTGTSDIHCASRPRMATIEIHAPRTERRHDVKFYYEKADCDRIAALARRRGNAGAHIALAWSIRQRDPEQCLLAIERAE